VNNKAQNLRPNKLTITASITKYWPVALLWFTIFAFDLTQRFVWFSGAESLGELSITSTSPSEIVSLDDQAHQGYLEKLGKNILFASPDTDAAGLGGAKGQEKPSELGVWANNDASYRLVAIFNSGTQFAVLSESDNQTGAVKSISVRAGDMLGRYLVAQITTSMMVLDGQGQESIELRLFKPLIGGTQSLNSTDDS